MAHIGYEVAADSVQSSSFGHIDCEKQNETAAERGNVHFNSAQSLFIANCWIADDLAVTGSKVAADFANGIGQCGRHHAVSADQSHDVCCSTGANNDIIGTNNDRRSIKRIEDFNKAWRKL
ncbi:unannotated protein [freshwater metagenome]|uniref:Unannotated protein n=1 Tax=freshwater metagenome TaxID=449393 RepID=A0A6J6IT04_9ZZZZ